MNDETPQPRRKFFVIALLGLFIGLLAFSIADQALNQEIAFEYVLNNTDLYNNGRITGVNYTANNSAIQLFLIFHVVGTGASIVVDTNLSINGTVVEDRDYRTSAGAGIHEHFSMTAHIPKGANYSVTNNSNLHTIEWREYPILSGRNGTLSINQTIGGGTGTGSQNLSQVLTQGNEANNQGISNISSISGNDRMLNITNSDVRIGKNDFSFWNNETNGQIYFRNTNAVATSILFSLQRAGVNSVSYRGFSSTPGINSGVRFALASGIGNSTNATTHVGDPVGQLTFQGFRTDSPGEAGNLCCHISAFSLSNVTPTNASGKIVFATSSNSTSNAYANVPIRMEINDTGKIFLNNLTNDDNSGVASLCINKATNEVYVGTPGC